LGVVVSRQLDVLSRDPESLRSWLKVLRPCVKAWHRSEVRGLEHVPDGASLIVSNHSGGAFAMDWPVFVVDFADRFGIERPLYLLSHNVLFHGRFGEALRRVGLVPATREVARTVLDSGATLMVFPGGDYDAGRPTSKRNVIDFDGRTGYVATAVQAGVPIVPMVSIGGHENQLYLTHGRRLAELTGLSKAARVSVLPISFGFPFGPSLGMVMPLNAPLPTKIVTQLMEPIDVHAEFGDDPDPAVVDAHVRKVMQSALDELANRRRFPVIG
jgi:1-acyl-sn-glycerol-3-phosphate acyltransferase